MNEMAPTMTSMIAWLDASTEEQRRMRDIIRLFTDRDSRDELGLGQVRDGLADALFPGSSTLHTRARYLLFIPWIFVRAAEKGKDIAWANNLERSLIDRLKDSEDFAGLLGLRAGKQVVTLPSSIYWAALGTYGIRTQTSLSREQALETPPRIEPEEGDFDVPRVWSASLPSAPSDFPYEIPNGFAMRCDEAAWLRERMLTATHGTLYAHLLEHPPEAGSATLWRDPSALSATGEPRQWVTDAHRFSDVMHGAQLLYNLLLAETQRRLKFVDDDERVEHYRSELTKWAIKLETTPSLDPECFNDMMTRLEILRGSPLNKLSKRFLLDWYQHVRESPAVGIADDDVARHMIERREKRHKGPLARLQNTKRLNSWGGSSGASALVYRWSYVQQFIVDIHDGLNREPELDNA